jgi:GH18 family chitinase
MSNILRIASAPALLFLASTAAAQTPDPPPFRVVGYYSLRAASTADPATVPFDRLTHVNLSFLNPDASGTFTQDLSGLKGFIDAAHQKNVKVLASIGGGGQHEYYHELLTDPKRPALVERLRSIAVTHNLDGIDVDLEGRAIDANYEPFAIELARALRSSGKLITAAIAVFYKDSLTDRALEQYDFVNIMSYDHTGPWRPERPGPHAPYEEAVNALEYFGVERRIPKSKMVLGVPFYGYGFASDGRLPPASMNFREITEAFAGSEHVDEWPMPDGKTMYYNGIPTIRRKTVLAREKASGVMIWQILGDAPGDKSLLKAINEAK